MQSASSDLADLADLPDSASREVLYVEDHPTNVRLMQAVFRRRPQLELFIAADGREAHRVAANIQPSLLLLDLRLPDCHGTDLLEQLRSRDGWADIPAVAVTAEPGFLPAEHGFVEVWAKPLDLVFVLDRLDQLIDRSHALPWTEDAAQQSLSFE